MNLMNDVELVTVAQVWAKSWARKLSLGRHIVDELAQEAAMGILHARTKYRADLGTLDKYAKSWALHYMRRHTNKMAGCVGRSDYSPPSVALLHPDASEGSVGVVDTRSDRGLSHESAEFSEALSRADARTQLMIEARMKGYDYAEIGEGLGLSREHVRRCVLAFAETLEVSV